MPNVPDTSLLFAGTGGPREADIAIVGESWGAEERRLGKPFQGRSGQLLNQILGDVGIGRSSVFVTNVVNAQPPGNDIAQFFNFTADARARGLQPVKGLYPKPVVSTGIEKLHAQLKAVNPKLVIALGNYALWALSDDSFRISDKLRRKIPTGIASWRGSQLYCTEAAGGMPLLPTYHPAAVLRQWPWYYQLKHDLTARTGKALRGEWAAPDYEFTLKPNADDVIDTVGNLLLQANKESFTIAVDLETRNGHIACIGIAWSDLHAICIPLMCIERDSGYWTEGEEKEIVVMIRKLLTHPNVRSIGQNYLYDAQYMAAFWGFVPTCWLDTMIGHHSLWPGTQKGLDYLSSLYCNYHRYWKDESKDWDPNVGEAQLWEYNCKDAVTTWEVAHVLDALADQLGLRIPFDIQQRQFAMVLRMMLRGIRIDTNVRASVSSDLITSVSEYEARFHDIMPKELIPVMKTKASPWWRSPNQQARIFYDGLGLSELKNRKTGNRTFNDEALERVSRIEPMLTPIVRMLQEYRSIGVFQNNFCRAELDPDDRMRCSFNISGTETIRWSSNKNAFGRGTNLQNIPSGSED